MRTRLRLLVNALICAALVVLFACLGSMSASASDGWVQDGETWYYYENGEKVYNTVKEIGGKYYGFGGDGAMYVDTSFNAYFVDSEYSGWYYFRAKADGTLYVSEWYHYQDEWSSWYYYGEGGKAASGFTQVKGNNYFFYPNGQMAVNDICQENGKIYKIDSEGKAYEFKEGWNKYDGHYYYVENGEIVSYTVKKIGEKYYGFNSSGVMYDNETFYLDKYDSEAGYWRYYYYRAKSGGALYVNEWYQDEYGTRYYYGAEGVAPEEYTLVDGNYYYFWSSGEMAVCTYPGDCSFLTREDGTLYVNEWYESEYDYNCYYYYYYREEGRAANGLSTVDGNQYYFDTYGRMVTSQVVTWGGEGYVVDENGIATKMTTEGWNYVYFCYYYIENGKIITSCVNEINGILYYFDASGKMASNKVVCTYSQESSDPDKYYYAASNGALTELKNGWNKFDGKYYYLENGNLISEQIKEIGGKFYGFDSFGTMYDDQPFDMWGWYDSDGDWHDGYYHYRAKSGGVLYVNEWYHYQDEWNNEWYYYEEGGRAASGFKTVGGSDYCFSSDGQMMTNTICQANGKVYMIDSEGKAHEFKEGWNKYEGKYYYVSNGECVSNAVKKIGSSYYGFDYNGEMHDDQSFSFGEYDADGNWVYYCYRAKSGGALYVNEWYHYHYEYDWGEIDDDWYYYGEGGKAVSGFTQVGEDTYCFNSEGKKLTDTTYSENGKVYKIDSEGKAYEFKEGWNKYDGKYYYVSNGTLVSYTVRKIGEKFYGFNSEGVMYDNQSFGMDRYDSYDGSWLGYSYYRAKSDGALYVNEWYWDGNGKYYYGEDGATVQGMETIDGKLYCFNSEGMMYCNQAFDYWDYEDQTYHRCRASADGALLTDTWYEEGYDSWCYYGMDGVAVGNGMNTVRGKQYYFNGYELATDEAFSVDGVNYYADASGNLTVLENGWSEIEGNRYYVDNGTLAVNVVKQIGGKYYGFAGTGKMYVDWSFTAYSEAAGMNGSFRAGSDGALYVNEWMKDAYGNYFYYGDYGIVPEEYTVQTVKGKQYYFLSGGLMATSGLYSYDGKAYAANSDGSLTELKDGWNKVGGKYYYLENGEFVTDQIKNIGGYWYAFDYDGVMFDDCEFELWYPDEEGYEWIGGYFRAKAGGKLYVNEWYEGDELYHYGERGKADNGICEIDGILYFFDWNGSICTSGSCMWNDKPYAIQPNGKMKELRSGWNNIEGTYYYVKPETGIPACNEILLINGKHYGFESDGRMFDDVSFSMSEYDSDGDWVGDFYYRARSGGSLYENSWYKQYNYDSTDRYYYGADGKSPNGFATVDGKMYYFEEGKIKTTAGFASLDGKTYYIDEDGALTELKEGWNKLDGRYCYLKNGEIFRYRTIKIGGKLYGFDDDGWMYTDTSFSASDENWERYGYFRATADGSLLTNKWYEESYDTWYYFDADGFAVGSGMNTINGKKYYFEQRTLVTNRAFTAGGVNYFADASGNLTELKNGWNKFDGNYYYVDNGTLAKNIVKLIGGKYYGFDGNGKMFVDWSFWTYSEVAGKGGSFRAGSDGAILVNTWMEDEYGNFFYYGDYGFAPDEYSVQTVNGKMYYFLTGGLMATSGLYSYDGKAYAANSDGSLTELKDGWNKIDGSYYYLENGKFVKNQLKKIDGYWYGFDYDGVLYEDMTFGMESYDAQGNYEYNYYHAKVGGKIVTDEWYKAPNGVYWRGDKDGKCLNGKHTINGVDYYFNNGKMAALCEIKLDGVTYYADADGKLNTYDSSLTGLRIETSTYSLSSNLVYYENGKKVTNDWRQVSGKWYYFDENGNAVDGVCYVKGKYYYFCDHVMQTGWIRDGDYYYGSIFYAESNGVLAAGEKKIDGKWYYFYETGNQMCPNGGIIDYKGKYYMLDANGAYTATLASQKWTKIGDDWYYITKDGIPNDMTEVNGSLYCFSAGRMLTNTVDYNRVFGADGKAVETDGWYKVGDYWYYVKNGVCLSDGIKMINGAEYYFDYDGEMLTGEIWVDGKIRTYGSNGKLVSVTDDTDGETETTTYPDNKWTLSDGYYYYYRDGQPYTGWVGDYYVSSGIMQRNRVVFSNEKYYYVDNEGRYVKSGWINDTYYAKPSAGGRLAENEWLQIDGTWYYFKDCTAIDGAWVINNKAYIFDENGAMIYENKTPSNGWISAGGKWYYYFNGEFFKGEVRNIGGKNYGFNRNGAMVTDDFLEGLSYSDGYYGERERYGWFNSKGTQEGVTGWKTVGDDKFYIGETGREQSGWIKIDGKQNYLGYRSSDQMAHGK